MKTVKFGMFWRYYGYQTVELPDHIYADDTDTGGRLCIRIRRVGH